jgi:hypothetical protein
MAVLRLSGPAILLVACLVTASQARAEGGASITGVRVGFAGHYRVGFWTPVEVTLRGGDDNVMGRLSLSLADGDGIRSEVTAGPFEIMAGQETRINSYVKFGNPRGDLVLRLHRDQQRLAERRIIAGEGEGDVEFREAFASTQGLLLTLGKPIGIEEAVGRARDVAEKIHVVNLTDAGELPDEWLGYEGVDQLVIGPSPVGINQALAAGSPRLVALDRWVREGGRLILALGGDSEEYLSSGRPLAEFLPGALRGNARLTRTTSLEMFGGTFGGAPLRWQRGQPRGLAAARLIDVQGHVELAEGDFPLLVRRAYTFGEVTFIAVDFSQPPLADWAGRNLSIKRALRQRITPDASNELETAPTAAHLGLVDLSGQLRSTLDQFGGVRLAPFWAVAALAAVYIALIGPIDFLLLKTVVRRMEWTWCTFPLVVLVFCGGAAWAAYRLKGDRLLVNQVDLVDVDLASSRVRGTTWFNLFSPETATYDLSLELRAANQRPDSPRDVLLSWQGLPGNVLGGMEQGVSAPTSIARSYQFAANRAELSQVPIAVWSSKSFVGRWQTEAAPTIEADLKLGRDDVVEGSIVNRMTLPLKDCLLVAGRWAWELDELPTNAAAAVRAGEQRDLLALLKDFKLVRERDKDTLVQVATPYDQASFNVRSILQQMMFYRAGSGRTYTGLLNRYQSYLDLSDHLELGQVILWGRVDTPAAAVCRDGQPLDEVGGDHSTFYRFVIPTPQ